MNLLNAAGKPQAAMRDGMNKIMGVFLGAILLILAGFSNATEADLIIRNARVLSPPKPPLEHANIVIRGNKILYVGPEIAEYRAITYIDASNKTVLPGLIDTHVHLILGANSDEAYQREIKDNLPKKFKDYITHGITTIMSMGEYWPQALEIRQLLNKGQLIGPRLLLVGPIIGVVDSASGGDSIGDPDCATSYCRQHWQFIADSVEKARRLVREVAAAEVDGIKIAYEYRKPGTQRARDILQAIITEAHATGLPVFVHVLSKDGAIEAMKLGADRLAHGPGVIHQNGYSIETQSIDDFISIAKQRKVTVATTLSPFSFYTDLWGEKRSAMYGTKVTELPDGMEGIFQKTFGLGLADVKYMTNKGVMLAFGTDLPHVALPSKAFSLEIAALREANLSTMQILTIATRNAAIAIGRDAELGSIDAGKLADLVLVDGNPLKNADFLERIDLVIKEGVVIFQRSDESDDIK